MEKKASNLRSKSYLNWWLCVLGGVERLVRIDDMPSRDLTHRLNIFSTTPEREVQGRLGRTHLGRLFPRSLEVYWLFS
jgi:hypothetical protein